MRKRRTKQQIYRILKKYQLSQLSQREFCNKNNIKLNTFQTWIGRYKKDKDFPLNPDVKGEVASNFLEIKPEKIDVTQQQITITYANQVSLALEMDWPPSSLIQLKQLLQCLD
ncbi:MAG: transposase [Flavobacteriaceae bacterium]|nr:transposase [Flavobacteriaceae bacterium]